MRASNLFLFLLFVPAVELVGQETRTEDFATEPGWQSLGNSQNGNSFGCSAETAFAGSGLGEGGRAGIRRSD